ncbi:MAG: FMN-binding negative transcriptional regulator [Caulobacteraceae bacterium]
MHPARAFHENDRGELIARVAARGFAVIAGAMENRPHVGHAPVLLEGARLRFHLSAANPLAEALAAGGRAVATILGEDAYVSPDWYGLEGQVPTWNYVSVEIEGPARVMSREETARLLDDLAVRYESPLAPKPPWTREKLDPAKFEAMLSAIVGFEVAVERLEGVTKLSQNKPAEAIARAAGELERLDDDDARAIAGRMFRLLEEGD